MEVWLEGCVEGSDSGVALTSRVCTLAVLSDSAPCVRLDEADAFHLGEEAQCLAHAVERGRLRK